MSQYKARSPSLVAPAFLLAALLGGLPAASLAAPPPAIHPALLDRIRATPEGSWVKVSTNGDFATVYTPEDLRPLKLSSNPEPGVIIQAWSGFAWDPNRGDLLLYGGGHANYSGNDVYRWRSSSLRWERASLPSEILPIGGAAYMAIDGADAAPGSAHTYDNNLFLPIADRFMTWGGALYDSGTTFKRPNEAVPGTLRNTGPYLFDPARAHPDKVGGTTGSHVQRVAPFPGIVGGQMWQNRDLPGNLAASRQPHAFANGCTAYAEEDGKDVVYVGGFENGSTFLNVYRYVLNDVAQPALDTISLAAVYWDGPAGPTVCAYDPVENLFVRTGTATAPFEFWDLRRTPADASRDETVEVSGSIRTFSDQLLARNINMGLCSLDFDPVRGQYAVWCGDGEVWMLRSPVDRSTTGWTIARQLDPVGDVPPITSVYRGILGKWKYAPGYDVFVALEGEGHVWIYKPVGWQAPNNASPTVALTSPAPDASFVAPASITLNATASDPDGIIAKVEFYSGTMLLASLTAPPYATTWAGVGPGTYVLRARATDDAGQSTVSADVTVTVAPPPNVPPQVALTQPAPASLWYAPATIALAATAFDSDGSIARVEFLNGGQVIGAANAAPYTLQWPSVPAGNYMLSARAIDNAGAATLSAPVNVVVQTPPVPVNVAASANGGVASASSTLARASVVLANDGERRAFGARSTGAWIDATFGQFPDWLQVDFAGVKTITRVDVVTVHDANADASEPAPDATFIRSGITAFEVQTWDGTAWSTVPGGLVTGNNRVWRTLTFPPIATSRLRLVVHAAASGYAQVAEIEAWTGIGPGETNDAPSVTLDFPGDNAVFTVPSTLTLSADANDADGTIAQVEFLVDGTVVGVDAAWPYAVAWTGTLPGAYTIEARATDDKGKVATSAPVSLTLVPAGASINAALQSNGGVATASTSMALGYPPSSAIDGDRAGRNWTRNGGWVDGTPSAFPDWLAVQFDRVRTIDRIEVFTVQDAIQSPSPPTPAMTFSRYGIVDYEVQWWDGTAWAVVPGGSVTGNANVWRSFAFPPVATDRIRVLVTGALDTYSRIVEVEAWTAP